jgi:hypothetical protein
MEPEGSLSFNKNLLLFFHIGPSCAHYFETIGILYYKYIYLFSVQLL